jgi:uncharacterized protein Veg
MALDEGERPIQGGRKQRSEQETQLIKMYRKILCIQYVNRSSLCKKKH